MKLTSHQRKSFWIVAIILVLVVAIGAYVVSHSDNSLNFCSYSDNGNKLCFGKQSSSDALSIVAINSAGKSSVAPNEATYVKIYTELPRSLVPPIYTAQVILRDDATGNSLDIWDVKFAISQQPNIASCLSGFGSCNSVPVSGVAGQIMTFNAPAKVGTYTVRYVVKDSQASYGAVLVDESTKIVVVSPQATVCPANTCSSWTNSQAIANGNYQQRSCVVFDSSCSGTTNYEYRTICSSGYLVSGTSNYQGNGYSSCVAQPVVQQPPVVQPEPTPVVPEPIITVQPVVNNTPVTPVVTNQTQQTNQTCTLTSCDVSDQTTTHSAFVQWFIDLWQSILSFFTVK